MFSCSSCVAVTFRGRAAVRRGTSASSFGAPWCSHSCMRMRRSAALTRTCVVCAYWRESSASTASITSARVSLCGAVLPAACLRHLAAMRELLFCLACHRASSTLSNVAMVGPTSSFLGVLARASLLRGLMRRVRCGMISACACRPCLSNRRSGVRLSQTWLSFLCGVYCRGFGWVGHRWTPASGPGFRVVSGLRLGLDTNTCFTQSALNDTIGKEAADVAQLVEQLIRTQQVIGSSPIVGSISPRAIPAHFHSSPSAPVASSDPDVSFSETDCVAAASRASKTAYPPHIARSSQENKDGTGLSPIRCCRRMPRSGHLPLSPSLPCIIGPDQRARTPCPGRMLSSSLPFHTTGIPPTRT